MVAMMHIPDPRECEVAMRYSQPFVEYFLGCQRVIDVASGQGHFLQILKEAGVNAEGVEVDSDLCALTRGKGLKVTQGNFFELLKTVPAGSYDGASASHIVEQFLPVQVEELFALLHRALKMDALLVVITPNIANIVIARRKA
jgi:O-antigen chain-terminating methyltransferase